MTNPFTPSTPAAAPAAGGGFAGGGFGAPAPAAAPAPQAGGFAQQATAAANQQPFQPLVAAAPVFGALPQGGSAVPVEDRRNIKDAQDKVVIIKFLRTAQVTVRDRPEKGPQEVVEATWMVLDPATGAVEEIVKPQYIFGKFIVQDGKNALNAGVSVVPAMVRVEVVKGNNSAKLEPITDPGTLASCEKIARDAGFL